MTHCIALRLLVAAALAVGASNAGAATTKDLKDLRVKPAEKEAAPADAAKAAEKPTTQAPAKVGSIVVFPITSQEEGLGKQVGEMLRAKAKRLGATTFDPSSVTDALAGETVTPDTPPAKLAALVKDKFQAEVGVTGHVKGQSPGPYEVRLVAVYPADKGPPRVIENLYACDYHQIIPLEMARAVRDLLGLPPAADPNALDPDAEKRWKDGPNLVRNPGFEVPNADKTGPADWQDVGKIKTGGVVSWVPNPDGPGKVVKFDLDEDTAENYGVAWYGDWIALEAGATYRFSCRYKSMGPTPKIFLKGYHAFDATDLSPAQRREVYRRQVHPGGPGGQWNTVVADFVPSVFNKGQVPTFLKVDLYAYYPAGIIYWDDIVLKKVRDVDPTAVIAPPPSPEAKK